MAIKLTIGTKVINFPSSGADPNWAPALIEFAEAVTEQLQTVASPFDISPRVQILANDANVNLDINSAVFPSGNVRSFTFSYAIYRTNGTIALAEEGLVIGVFDTFNTEWLLQHQFSGERQSSGDPYNTFSMDGDQLQLTTVAINGLYNDLDSQISYSARTLLTDNI